MTPKQFYDWQTAGGTDDVMRMVDCLERADLATKFLEESGFKSERIYLLCRQEI